MTIRRSRWGYGVAFAAALMLMLQSVTGAFAAGTSPNQQIDIFGNVLCVTSGAEHGIPDTGGHPKSGECCVAGCAMSSPVVASSPDAEIHVQFREASRLDRPGDRGSAAATRGYTPGNPRAPPLTA